MLDDRNAVGLDYGEMHIGVDRQLILEDNECSEADLGTPDF